MARNCHDINQFRIYESHSSNDEVDVVPAAIAFDEHLIGADTAHGVYPGYALEGFKQEREAPR